MNSWFWIARLDDPEVLVPLGSIGELLIESPQLGDGYLNDRTATDAVFVRDPPWAHAAVSANTPQIRRMFKTGDMVRMTESGSYIYVGRLDRQTKLGGQRIELGDIEAQLRLACPVTVPLAIELVHTICGSQQPALVAFFDFGDLNTDSAVPDALLMPSNPIFDAHLYNSKSTVADALPIHMVPTFYVPLQHFPIDSSGKLDRNQLQRLMHELPEAELQRLSLEHITKEPPRNTAERVLHEIWMKVLGVSATAFGINDSFLNLGGDSIVAMKLAKEVRSCGYKLTVADILRNPKLAAMADLIVLSNDDNEVTTIDTPAYQQFSLVDEKPGLKSKLLELANEFNTDHDANHDNIADIHPATDFQALSIEVSFRKSRNMLNYITMHGAGPADVPRLRRSVEAAVDKFEILRSAFVQHNGRVFQVVFHRMPEVEFAVYTTRNSVDDFMDELQDVDMGQLPAWGKTPTRFAIMEHENDGTFTFVARLSHAQYDGVSTPMIFDFLQATYNGQNVADEQFLSQAQYMHRLRYASQRSSLDYWQNLLSGSRMVPFPPVKASNGDAKMNGNGSSINGNSLSPQHKQPAPRHGITTLSHDIPISTFNADFTLATLVKACWASVLSTLSSQPDVVFGTLVNGRNVHEDASRVVGACANYVPVRLNTADHTSPAALMRATVDQAIASIPHEHIGFKELAQKCTTWGGETFFTSLVIHQNLEVDDALVLDGKVMSEEIFNRGMEPTGVIIESSEEQGGLGISLHWQDDVLDEGFAEMVLSVLCKTVERFVKEPEGDIRRVSGESIAEVTEVEVDGGEQVQVDGLAEMVLETEELLVG